MRPWWPLVVAACGQPSAYHCTSSDQCVEHGTQGTCELQGFCSFPDATCPSGRRFEQNAGDMLGGTCATGLPPDAGPPDGKLGDGAATAIAFVQGGNGGKADGALSQTVSFLQPVTAHDTLIVCTDVTTPGYAQVSDSLGNTFVPVVQVTNGTTRFYVFAAFDVDGGSDDVTFTVSAATVTFEVYLHEYAGLSAFDAGGGAVGTASGTDGMSSGPVQTHFANELIFGFGVTGTAAAGTSFTARSTFDSNITEELVASTTGYYTATATMVAGSGWTMLVATFR